MKELLPEQLDFNVFETVGKDWLLVTAEKDGKVNTMTASWGGMGILWGKPVAFVFIRPQRFTKEFVDGSGRFSLSVLPEGFRSQLNLLGTVSGRDRDKISDAGLHVRQGEGAPYFDEARLVFLCRKLYAQPLEEGLFMPDARPERWYPEKDYHTLYVAEIEKIMEKD